jgi:hypothetical protein
MDSCTLYSCYMRTILAIVQAVEGAGVKVATEGEAEAARAGVAGEGRALGSPRLRQSWMLSWTTTS